jgi:hypothetical protein
VYINLNRHYYFIPLLKAWNETGNEQYVNKFDSLIRDWVLDNPPPKEETHKATWRILEVGLRMASTWPETFYGFVNSRDFSLAGVLLMLSRIPDHVEYIKKYHENYNNRAAMELGGLGIAAMMFPEFRNSDEWLSYSKDRMLLEILEQVYPDGVQNELTSHYHWVALRHFYRFARYVDQVGVELSSDEYFNNLERMFNYLAYVLRPDGSNPLNNDSDRDTLLNWISIGADFFDRPDWRWIATGGKKGTRPEGFPSRVFPWAGQFVMKNNWSKDGHWAFFDIGPWGTGHQHEDKLHLSIHAYGRDILVDAGRFTYVGEVADKFRGPYATHSRGHNVLLIDGSGQNPGPREAKSPLDKEQYRITSNFDYARSSSKDFDISGGDVNHTRAVFYVKDRFWLVADRVESETPREITVLWHYHPDCRVTETGNGIASDDPGKGNIRIDPLGRQHWDRSIVEGQENPVIQGWYSVKYNKYRPSPAALFKTEDVLDETFVWLLLPSEGKAPEYNAEIEENSHHQVTVRVEMSEGRRYRVTIPFDDQGSTRLVKNFPVLHEFHQKGPDLVVANFKGKPVFILVYLTFWTDGLLQVIAFRDILRLCRQVNLYVS